MAKSLIITGALFLFLTLANCNTPSEHLTLCRESPEAQFTYSNLMAKNNLRLSQVTPVAIAFASDGQSIFVAYNLKSDKPIGELAQINLAEKQIVRSFRFDSFRTGLTEFSGDGEMLVSMIQVPCPQGDPRRCVEPRVWKTDSGEMVSKIKPFLGNEIRNLDVTQKGDWFISVQDGSVDMSNPTNLPPGMGILINDDPPEQAVSTAISRSANLIAYATDRKNLYLEQWDGQDLHDPYPWSFGPWSFNGGEATLDAVPIKLAISPDDKWLAVRSSDALELRDLSARFIPSHGKVSLEHSSNVVMEFDPSSSLLAIGDTERIQVQSIPNLEILLDRPSSEVTAASFSPDGCLLAWGDVEGAVHIINAPKP